MAKNKTTETSKSVTQFLNALSDKNKRNDSLAIIKIMTAETGFEPKMWGPSIIGFGTYHYKHESGREGDMPIVAFSPRSTAIVLYLSANFKDRDSLLQKFGKHKTGKGCIYIKKNDDIDISVLTKMIANSVKHRESLYSGK
jgi:hypothetical protein